VQWLYHKHGQITRTCPLNRPTGSATLRPFSTYRYEKTTHEEGPVSSFFKDQIQNGQLQEDHEQLDLARRLDGLLKKIIQTDSNVVHASKLQVDWFSDAPPKGVMDKVKTLWSDSFRRLSLLQTSTSTPRGIYIFGSVGVGKSFLMDIFHEKLQIQMSDSRRKIRRCHFNEFMLDIHQRIHEFKKQHPKQDPKM